jgi:4-amino-4-deoxy-L-arabinose transferase-like glycosyltransferase
MVFMALVPPLETPDEEHHLNYINYVSRRLALPNQLIPEKAVIGEGHQYPLYYVFGAAVVRALNADHGVELTTVPNKKHKLLGGDSLTVPSFHHAGLDIFKAPSDAFSFYVLRALSVLFGLITVVFIYRLAGLFFKEPPWACLAAVMAGTLPQFIFISLSVSNDGLSNALAAAALFYMVKIAASKDPRPDWKSHILLGLFLGLGVLAKKNGLVLLLPAALVLVRSAWLRRGCHPEHSEGSHSTLGRVGPAAAVVLIVIILTGWVFVRNQILYGDLLGNRMEKATLEPLGLIDEKTPTPAYVLHDFLPRLGTSFVAMFGQWASFLPLSVYYFYLAVFLAGLAGVLILLIIKSLRDFKILLMLVAWLVTLGAVFYYNLTYTQPQGRLLFPALGPIAVLTAVGLEGLFSRIKARSARRVLSAALVCAFLAIDVIAAYRLYHFYHDQAQYAAALFAGKIG